jgi:hypothetical protein
MSAGLPADERTADRLAGSFCVSREVIFRKLLDRGRITQVDYEEAATRWRNDNDESSGGGDYFNNQMVYLGRPYIALAFSRYYQNHFDAVQLAEHLNIKPKGVAALEERYLGLFLSEICFRYICIRDAVSKLLPREVSVTMDAI